MKIKVCGMRDATNIADLVALNPDFIGFIFHEKSPRNITEKPAITIPKNIHKVGVFVDKPLEFIQEKALEFELDYIQLHGKETPEFCLQLKALDLQTIKAFNLKADFDFSKLQAYEPVCDCFLFDAFGKQAGGNGITFNWDLLKKYNGNLPFLLSGGINETMATTINMIQHKKLIGIDINSGFEIEPALKDITKLKSFFQKIKA